MKLSRSNSFLKYTVTEQQFKLWGNVQIWEYSCSISVAIKVPVGKTHSKHLAWPWLPLGQNKTASCKTLSLSVLRWRSPRRLSGDISDILQPLKQKSRCLRGRSNKTIIPSSISHSISMTSLSLGKWLWIAQRLPGEERECGCTLRADEEVEWVTGKAVVFTRGWVSNLFAYLFTFISVIRI